MKQIIIKVNVHTSQLDDELLDDCEEAVVNVMEEWGYDSETFAPEVLTLSDDE